ncbi:MAG TPA: hypothetical protein P5081_03880 [Phycisphaerae bacterium]|nr:hypothetical protein [Phycisphaerae bacterium]HRW51999.1 hypothetical protein [Phycisphaerae bacterium]
MSKKFHYGFALLLSVGVVSSVHADPPAARIGYTVGVWKYFTVDSGAWSAVTSSGDPGYPDADYYYVRNVTDEHWTAVLEYLGNDEWKLDVTNQLSTLDLDRVSFPWESSTKLLGTGDDPDDNIAFSCYQAGIAKRTEDQLNNGNYNFPHVMYPGSAFAPFVIIADDTKARIGFASNSPPKSVYPNARKNGITLEYQGLEIGENETESFRLTLRTVTGSAGTGDYPWYKAALEYRDWLRSEMTSEGVYPVVYNDWMVQNHGFLNLQLENMLTASMNAGAVYTKWNEVKDDLSWVLMWGQMSDYSGSCCGSSPTLHSRYTATDAFGTGVDIYDFVDDVKGNGDHVGFYSRSQNYPETLTSTYQEAWAQWLDNQRDIWGGNSYYLDVLGAVYHGPAYDIASLFDQTWTVSGGTSALGFDGVTTDDGPDSLIEGVVDAYPAAFMISGAMGMDLSSTHTGGPTFTLEVLEANGTGSDQMIFFPRLATVVCNDRLFYSGENNGGYSMWGDFNYRNLESTPDDSWNYWVERNAFLMGHKLDVIHNLLADYSTENPRMRDILDLRDGHNWWSRSLRYQDIDGLTNIDSRLRVRRFEDQNGESVFAVEWWGFDSGSIPSPLPTFEFDSTTYDAPEAIFGIVETAFNYASSSACDSNNNGTPDYAESMACIYDVNGSGDVDSCDVDVVDNFSGHCSPSSGYVSIFDYDCDGCVDADDKALVVARLGESCN